MSGGSDALDPVNFPQSWDIILIGGIASPGVCKISEAKRAHEWDQKRGKGVRGATLTFTGIPLATFSVTFRLWDDGSLGTGTNHFVAWAAFIPLLKYDPTKKQPTAVDIYHPALADIDIKSVVAESIGQLEPVQFDGTQYYDAVVQFVEYAAPPKKSAVATPSGSTNQYIALGDKTQPAHSKGDDDAVTLASLQSQLQQAQQGLP